jgi:hypothetical protein
MDQVKGKRYREERRERDTGMKRKKTKKVVMDEDTKEMAFAGAKPAHILKCHSQMMGCPGINKNVLLNYHLFVDV